LHFSRLVDGSFQALKHQPEIRPQIVNIFGYYLSVEDQEGMGMHSHSGRDNGVLVCFMSAVSKACKIHNYEN